MRQTRICGFKPFDKKPQTFTKTPELDIRITDPKNSVQGLIGLIVHIIRTTERMSSELIAAAKFKQDILMHVGKSYKNLTFSLEIIKGTNGPNKD